MLADLLAASLIALIVVAFFTAFAGGLGPSREVLGVFLLTVLVTWSVGVWVAPFGPALWGRYWLPFLVPGLLFLLLLAALVPTRRAPPTYQEAVDRARADDASAGTALVALSGLFWVLIVALAVSAGAAYL